MVDGKNQSPSWQDAKNCCVVSKKQLLVPAVLCQADCPGSPDDGQLTKAAR